MEWAVWMTKPNGLSVEDKQLYHRMSKDGKCYLKNVVNRKGIPMLVVKGTLPPNVRDLNGFFIEMRRDFQEYINKLKRG